MRSCLHPSTCNRIWFIAYDVEDEMVKALRFILANHTTIIHISQPVFKVCLMIRHVFEVFFAGVYLLVSRLKFPLL